MKIEVQIFIPVTDNDGNLFTPGHDKDFLQLVVAELGGCSMLPASVVGVWQEDGITYDDHSRVLVLAVDGLIAHGEQVCQIAILARDHYQQLAVYARYLGVSEIL